MLAILQMINSAFYNGCGTEIKFYYEQFVYYNLIDDDGCFSNCKIEVDYKCQEKLKLL
ncbi:unnamed protein product [Paramecium primaurelia]|uniref:Uncharacterized protein n=1 Tax=Paramecium primaurelia TaxID=5886 RepID=A0A8S1QR43_PARPR|nr:unnamed protein product [Paramecium primaurelia]